MIILVSLERCRDVGVAFTLYVHTGPYHADQQQYEVPWLSPDGALMWMINVSVS